MGSCVSSPAGAESTEEEKARNREVEKQLKEVCSPPIDLAQTDIAVGEGQDAVPGQGMCSSGSAFVCRRSSNRFQVLLLGSGDSGKSTILKQMRLIHKVPFSPQEIESYRQLVFENLTRGMAYLLDSMEDMDLRVSAENEQFVDLVMGARDIRDGEPFPTSFYQPLKMLWNDPNVKQAWQRGNEAALPEKCVGVLLIKLTRRLLIPIAHSLSYFYSSLDRLFDPLYQPTEQDIIRCRARTIGITETTFHLRDHEMLMVDVGGQKSERRKWIHCFQDVTSILFLVSLSGYDQCLVEDKDAVSRSLLPNFRSHRCDGANTPLSGSQNQMQDAMTIWDSICHSQWFKQTSIVRGGLYSNVYVLITSFRDRFFSLTRTISSSRRSRRQISRPFSR